MITDRLRKQMEFMLEIDKLKNITRQTYIINEHRKENDAEHSWHIAVLAFLLAEYADPAIDVTRVMKMLLLHDIVEIDAGDTYCYYEEGYKSKPQREENAARRIFGILPEDQAKEFYSLWREFEDGITPEAKFAAVLDRIQPLTLNYAKDGVSWIEHGVHAHQVEQRNKANSEASPQLAELIQSMISDASRRGLLK